MKKKVLSLFMVIMIMLCISCNTVSAADEEYKHFLQGDSRWCSYVYSGGSTIGSAGCAITSLAICMAYADPDLRDINKFNPKVLCSENYFSFVDGDIYWNPNKGPLTLVDVAINNKNDVKEAYKKGYYIIAWSGRVTPSQTHYSPIVGWDKDEDKPIIWDVGGGGNTWDAFTANGTDIQDFRIYKSSKLKSTEAFSGTTSNDGLDADLQKKQKEAYANMVKEWELHGMPSKSNMTKDAQDIELPNNKGLTLAEKINVSDIKDNMDARHKNIYQVMSIVFSVVGFLLVVYALLLCIGYVFDRTNSFINVSMVSVLTMGKIKITDKGETISEEMSKEGYVKPSAFYARSLVIFLVGCLLISGVVQKLVMWVVYSIIG